MNFTFGIITTKNSSLFLQSIVNSISELDIPNYEIVIVGGLESGEIQRNENFTIVPFDESKKRMWITKKKNIITENAKYENIVYLHDYITFHKNWYDGFLKYVKNHGDFNVITNVIENSDGTRFRDWNLNDSDVSSFIPNLEYLLPYEITHLSKYMYISGAYWVAKKSTMLEFPLDESRSWAESEDIEWSKRVREKHDFKFNKYSTVSLLKQKEVVFRNPSKQSLEKILSLK